MTDPSFRDVGTYKETHCKKKRYFIRRDILTDRKYRTLLQHSVKDFVHDPRF